MTINELVDKLVNLKGSDLSLKTYNEYISKVKDYIKESEFIRNSAYHAYREEENRSGVLFLVDLKKVNKWLKNKQY